MQRCRSRGHREGAPDWSTRGAVGPPVLQGKKAETTRAHIIRDLHAGLVLCVIGVFLQLNMHSFVHMKVSYYACLISHILRWNSSDIAKPVFFLPNENCLDDTGFLWHQKTRLTFPPINMEMLGKPPSRQTNKISALTHIPGAFSVLAYQCIFWVVAAMLAEM